MYTIELGHLMRLTGLALSASVLVLALAACQASGPAADEPPPAGVIFTYPVDGQRDVPLGARLLVSFSGPVAEEAADETSVVGPDGPADIETSVVGEGRTLAIASRALQPGTSYEIQLGAAGEDGQPVARFTTTGDGPLAGPPELIAFNGSDPSTPGTLRPIYETSTLALVFSEPLDSRSVALEPGAIEIVDTASAAAVPATLVAQERRVALDPVEPLSPGVTYELRLGDRLVDLAGEALAPAAVAFTPLDSIGRGAIRQTFRTREPGDPNAGIALTDASNVIELAHPLIGVSTASVLPTVHQTELGDPRAQGGPIPLSIPKGQRLASTGLDVALAGVVPSGLATGDIWIELLTDAGGRLYRNPHRPDLLPDNTHAPLLVDLTLDLAVFATDPTGNAVLAQTVLGVQLAGVAIADEGALAIEVIGGLDIDLLGIASASTNIVLDLISAPGAIGQVDDRPPTLLTSRPTAGTRELARDEGIELIFDEPIDIERARSGGVALVDANGAPVPALLEIHGSVVVVRPRGALADRRTYRVDLSDVADVTGNTMAPSSFELTTRTVVPTDVPPSVVAVHPGAPCSLVDGSLVAPGRCAGGLPADDSYRPFALAANRRIAVVFDQAVDAASVTLGAACDPGSVRVERVSGSNVCREPVAGSLVARARELTFVPDRPWVPGERYRLRLVSGLNSTCEPGDLCGANGRPANFDRLAGTAAVAGGGPDLVIDFVGAEATTATTLFAAVSPPADLNGSGLLEQGERPAADNRVALRVTGTSGLIGAASFQGPDCLSRTPAVEACMYVAGAMPAQLGESRADCALPDGSTAATCVPLVMSAQAMYSTSLSMTASVLGIPLTTATGMSVMRVRERSEGPLEGYVVERDGQAVVLVSLDLYMDAPDMSLPLAQHDMHSKPLSVMLEGPLKFLPDGRTAITLRNRAEVPISIGIVALGLTGSIDLVVPAGEMKLELVSPPRRGSAP